MGVATNTKVPCFNCSNRSITCHSECEQYLLYKKERDSTNENIRKQKELENMIRGFKLKRIERCNRANRTNKFIGQH